MGQLAVGDKVFDDLGRPCRVTFHTGAMLGHPCYRLLLSDGTEIVADAEHEWLTETRAARKSLGRYRGQLPRRRVPRLVTTKEIAGSLYCDDRRLRPTSAKRRGHNHSIRVCGPLQYPEAALPIEPYTLGAWLGDGSSRDASIFVAAESREVLAGIRSDGYRIVPRKVSGDRCPAYGISRPGEGAGLGHDADTGRFRAMPNNLKVQLRALGVLGDKRIPRLYLEASESQRWALLKGLMDTDGSIESNGRCEFTSTSLRLILGVKELCLSLGLKVTASEGRAKIGEKDCGPKYRVRFRSAHPVFTIERKLSRQPKTLAMRHQRRYVIEATPIESVPVCCIQVDSESHLYLASRSLVPTHNTRLGALMAVAAAARGRRAWWVAPSYKMAAVGYRNISSVVRQIPGAVERRGVLMWTLPGGGTVQVRSADDPQSLRGEGLSLIVFDECGYMVEAAWTEAGRPSLSDTMGRAVFISTPAGRNWFWRLYERGRVGEDADWKSWRYPTSDNPFIDAGEIEAARNDLPDLIFRQEYLAEFLEGEGTVFHNIRACLHAPLNPLRNEHKGHRIVAGIDWAQKNDFTCISLVCTKCMEEVARARFRQIDYATQRDKLAALCLKWKVSDILAEANAMGTPNIEALQSEGLPVRPFDTTAASKGPLIRNLQLALEREEIQWQADKVWTIELEAYEQEINPVTGRATYSAPDGLNDDTVIARALAARAVGDAGPWLIEL